MYNSIATGVKRAQPLILDNLGLTIKVGAANEKYAASIGKTVEQLTAEEKTMAILAATLEAGDRMIQQVGGSTEAMGDSFAEAEVQIKNATDELKTKFAPAVAEVVGFLANMVTGLEKTQEATDALIGSADSYDEYLDAVLAVAQANDQLFQQDVDQIKKQAELGEEYHRTVTAMGILTEEQWKSYDAVETLAGGIENLSNMQDDTVYTTQELGEALTSAAEPIEIVTEASQAAATAFYEAGDAAAIQQSHLEGLVAKAQAVADAERDAALASDEFKGSLDNLHMAISGEVGDAYDDYKQKVEDLDQALADGELSSKDYKSAIDDETQAFRDNTAAIIFNIAQKQILDALEKGLIEDVNNSGTAFDEANDILWILADTLGIVDEETLALMKTVQDDTQAMIDGTISAETLALRLGDTAYQARDAALGMDDLRSGIQNIPEYKKFVFETHYTTTGTPSGEGGPGYTPPPPPQMMQHGGQFLVRGAAGPDRVPVNFMATRGEVVTVTPVGGQAPADPSVTNNYNLTLNSQAGSQGVIRDFDIMQSM